MSCQLSDSTTYGIHTVWLENDLVRAGILVGKGAEPFSLVEKGQQIEFMMTSSVGYGPFAGRDLSRDPLTGYSEIYPGGWQDLLPDHASWDGGKASAGGGIAATRPWQVEGRTESADGVSIDCGLTLEAPAFRIHKRIFLKEGDSTLYLEEEVENHGLSRIDYIWVQHAAFGGDFIDPEVEVVLPECMAFDSSRYRREGGVRVEDYLFDPVGADGGFDFSHPLPRDCGRDVFFPLRVTGEPAYTLINRRLGLSLTVAWDGEVLKDVRYWSCATDRCYTLAPEPASSYLMGLKDAATDNRVLSLDPGERHATFVNLSVKAWPDPGRPVSRAATE